MSKKCQHCGVYILDDTDRCPLCHGVLDGNEAGVQSYPNIVDKMKKMSLALRILLSVWIVTMIALGIASYYNPQMLVATHVVGVTTFYVLFMLWLMSRPHYGYIKRIYLAIIVGVVMVIFLDWILGYRGWSLNYVLPAGLILLDVALIILRLINRRNWQSYMVHQLGIILLGLVPAWFIHIGWIRHPILSVCAIAISLVMFVVTLILGGRAARTELKRRFHV